jgi:hypothetical protein
MPENLVLQAFAKSGFLDRQRVAVLPDPGGFGSQLGQVVVRGGLLRFDTCLRWSCG